MKIHLCSAYEAHDALNKFRHAASLDRHNVHQLCDSPAEADIILFVEDAHFDNYLYSNLLNHTYIAQWRDKCFMYNEVDQPWTVLPGLYCSMPSWCFEENRQRAFPYVSTPNQHVQNIFLAGDSAERPLLFSFVGTGCNNLRKRMIKKGLQQGGAIIDTSGFNVWDCSAEEKRQQGETFAKTMQQSKYVLCPRGLGSSSFRLFETMQAGRAPVIIADNWVQPDHSDWSFAVKIKENELHTIAGRLNSIADEAAERGLAARAAWEASYAPNCLFHTACQNLLDLKEMGEYHKSSITSHIRREQVRFDSILMQATTKLRDYRHRNSLNGLM